MRDGNRSSRGEYPVVTLWLLIGVAACGGDSGPVADEALPTLGPVTALESPAAPGSGEPFVHTSADGSVLMSWIEAGDTSHSVRFARLTGTEWSAPRTIAESSDFFVNWADFPSIIELRDGSLAAHWLKRSGPGTYSYDTWVAFSADGGTSWSDPVRPHEDGTPTEHGFVTLFEVAGRAAAVWLDGRQHVGWGGEPPRREMTVRYTTFDAAGAPLPSTLIDARSCDCCQTAVAVAAGGPVLVYRDRSADEIRDIAATRLVGGEWTEGMPVHDDRWEIDACPVNGPAIDAAGDRVAVAWFTAARDTARVRVAFSSDSGVSFDPPIEIDLGSPTGRVDLLLLDDHHALVSWLERSGGAAQVLARTVSIDGRFSEPVSIGGSSPERASGFPRMTRTGDRVIFAWTVPGEAAVIDVAAAAIR
jgi:hypothetical protein